MSWSSVGSRLQTLCHAKLPSILSGRGKIHRSSQTGLITHSLVTSQGIQGRKKNVVPVTFVMDAPTSHCFWEEGKGNNAAKRTDTMLSTKASDGSNWASWSITMWERVCQWEKHSQIYIALPAPQCCGLSQWKSAGRGPRPEHHRQQRSSLCRSQPFRLVCYFS